MVLTGGGTNRTRKLLICFLSSFISFSPITAIIACNKKDEITDEGSNKDKTIELFSSIKTKISDQLSNSEKTKIYLDAKDLEMKKEDVKKILNPIFNEAETQEVFVNNNIILNKITEKIDSIVNDLNAELKKLPALENSGKIITLNNLKAKMNGNDIKTLIDLIDKRQSAPIPDSDDFDYNLQLNLNFKINVENKEDNYIYNPKSAFITSDKEGLNKKIYVLADKLKNQELDGKKIIDNVLNKKIDSYEQSFSNELNTILEEKKIKIEKSDNMEINREQLSFNLSANNITKFAEYILKEENIITTLEQLFDKTDHEFYQFKNYTINNGKIFTQNYKSFTLNKWSIEGIELPKRDLTDIKIYHKKNDIEKSWRAFYSILRISFDYNIWYKRYYLYAIWIAKNFMNKDEVAKLTWSILMNKWINNYIKAKMDKQYLLNFDYIFSSKINLQSKKIFLSTGDQWDFFYDIIHGDNNPKLIFVYDGLSLLANEKSPRPFYILTEK